MFQSEPDIPLNQIAHAIIKLSDFYIAHPEAPTPWDEELCLVAYRHYFLPLNYQRNLRVVQKGYEVGFFDGLTTFIDWGCGPGTASLALANFDKLKPQIKKQILIDRSQQVLDHFKDLHEFLVCPEKTTHSNLKKQAWPKEGSCLVCSYSLTEATSLPEGWESYEALMILEPSTQDDARSLLELRQRLIDQNYLIWGPCTHQLKCPLLTESKTDWCHDRVVVEAPNWFLKLEQHLPMRNRTVTTSYLLARKKKASALSNQLVNQSGHQPAYRIGRLVGDSREEKGKTRQMLCRGEKREFLTWMHKHISPQFFPRGELIELPEQFEEKANELRVLKNIVTVKPRQ